MYVLGVYMYIVFRGARVAYSLSLQWWERSPPTSVARVRFLDLASHVGWVCCWFSPCSERFFSGYSGLPPTPSPPPPPMWPGFDSRTQRHMWVEFVVGSLLAPRGFSPGTPVFLPPPPPPSPTSVSQVRFPDPASYVGWVCCWFFPCS